MSNKAATPSNRLIIGEIENIEDLRNHAINVLKRLANKEISVEEATANGKLCSEVVNTIKVQLEYAKMTEQKPEIAFLEEVTVSTGRLLDSDSDSDSRDIKQLPYRGKH